MKNRGLGNDECNFWCRLKKNAKKRLTRLAVAILTFNVGAIAAVAGSIIGESINWGGINFRAQLPTEDITESEASIIDAWNENHFIPFLQKIENLLVGNNQEKNTALTLIQIYIRALSNEQAEGVTPVGLSVNAQKMRLAYVVDVFSDLTATLTTPPGVLTQVNIVAKQLDLMSDVADDLAFVPQSVQVKLYSNSSAPVSVDVNNANQTKSAAVTDTLLNQNPTKAPVEAIVAGLPSESTGKKGKAGLVIATLTVGAVLFGAASLSKNSK